MHAAVGMNDQVVFGVVPAGGHPERVKDQGRGLGRVWDGVATAALRALQRPHRGRNTRIRLIARRAFGFHSPDALIALTKFTLGRYCPPLPR